MIRCGLPKKLSGTTVFSPYLFSYFIYLFILLLYYIIYYIIILFILFFIYLFIPLNAVFQLSKNRMLLSINDLDQLFATTFTLSVLVE